MKVQRRTVLVLAAAFLVLGICIAGLISVRTFTHKITDRELLLEALDQFHDAPYPNEEIFSQQAQQGYYDDALATARLASKKDDLYSYLFKLATIRIENGDIQGAKNMIAMFPDPAFQRAMIKSIALAQAHQGHITGALQTCAPLQNCNEILLEFSRYQIDHAGFRGALVTAERLPRPSDVFYEIGSALRLRGEQKRARELAAGMGNRKLAALFLEVVPFTMWDHLEDVRTLYLSACEMAYEDATHNQFPKAVQTLQQNHCRYSYTAIRYYEIDPAAAEKLMRSSTNPDDLRFGLQELAMALRKKEELRTRCSSAQTLKKLTH